MGIFHRRRAISEHLQLLSKRPPQIDADKEYDIYCHGYRDAMVVHRRVKFKGKQSLPGEGGFGTTDCYNVVERSDGSQLFLPAFLIFMFCEHGVDPGFEILTAEWRRD